MHPDGPCGPHRKARENAGDTVPSVCFEKQTRAQTLRRARPQLPREIARYYTEKVSREVTLSGAHQVFPSLVPLQFLTLVGLMLVMEGGSVLHTMELAITGICGPHMRIQYHEYDATASHIGPCPSGGGRGGWGQRCVTVCAGRCHLDEHGSFPTRADLRIPVRVQVHVCAGRMPTKMDVHRPILLHTHTLARMRAAPRTRAHSGAAAHWCTRAGSGQGGSVPHILKKPVLMLSRTWHQSATAHRYTVLYCM